MSPTTCLAAYQIRAGHFLYGLFLVGLGVDRTVIADTIDLLALPSNLSDSVALSLLELLNELVHDIDEDHLQYGLVNTLYQVGEGGSVKSPQSQTDIASRQRNHGQCSRLQSEQL